MISRRKFFQTFMAAGLIPGLASDRWANLLTGGELGLPPDQQNAFSKNRIIGIGTAGINILDQLLESRDNGIDGIACHTNLYRLACSRARTKIPLVIDRIEAVGVEASEFQLTPVAQAALWDSIQGAEELTIVAGLGGKTGTHFVHLISRLGKEADAFIRMVAIMPFPFEGKIRLRLAEEGLQGLGLYVNESIIFNNDFAMEPEDEELEFSDFPEMVRKANVLLVKIIKEALESHENFFG